MPVTVTSPRPPRLHSCFLPRAATTINASCFTPRPSPPFFPFPAELGPTRFFCADALLLSRYHLDNYDTIGFT